MCIMHRAAINAKKGQFNLNHTEKRDIDSCATVVPNLAIHPVIASSLEDDHPSVESVL
jgi:hypothetical protein